MPRCSVAGPSFAALAGLATLAAASALTGCSSGNDQVPVAIQFAAEINGASFDCGKTYQNVGTPAVPFTPTDARFYVHDVELVDSSGSRDVLDLDDNTFQGNGLALLDFENGCGSDGSIATHTQLTGRATRDAFTKVRFTVGVPSAQNFVDLAKQQAPLDVTGMFWIWQFGYKFLKIDGTTPTQAGGVAPFFVHLGASGCPGSNPEAPPTGACTLPNEATYELAVSKTGTVVADLGALLAASNLSFNTADTAPGCMSEENDPECATLMPRLGIGIGSAQQLFKAR